MAKTIGQLTQATTLADGDKFPIEQGGVTKHVDASVVRGGLVNANMDAAAAIELSKLATGALPTAITVSTANLVSAVANALVPVSTVQSFARSTAPTGWLAANGDTIGSAASNATNASADYSALFTALWDNWTNTDLPILTSGGSASTRGANAATDFAANKRLPLPDLRGVFVRGSGSQTIGGIAYNKTFAAKEGDAFQGHYHTLTNGSSIWRNTGGGALAGTGVSSASASITVDAPTTDGTNGAPRTASETRPANIALLYCIKF
jgi:hypothetical protein